MKYITHWTIAFITLFVITFIGIKDPQIKEILRLKSFSAGSYIQKTLLSSFFDKLSSILIF